MTRRELIALFVLLMAGEAARASETYRDPSGAFSMTLANGWTVTRRPMSEDVCPGWKTDVQSPADAYSRLSVLNCAVETDPNRLREEYYREVPQAQQQDNEFTATQQQLAAQLQSFQAELAAQNDMLRQIIGDPDAAPAARQKAKEMLARNEAAMQEMAKGQASGARSLDDPAHTARSRQRLLEATGKPYFRGFINALQGQGRVEGVGSVARSTALGRDAMRSDFTFLPEEDGKPRKGFAIYLLGDGMTYFIAATASARENGALVGMFESIALAH